MDRLEYAKRQAVVAREQGLRCENEGAKQEWLRVAGLWEALAHEYSELARLKEKFGGPTAA